MKRELVLFVSGFHAGPQGSNLARLVDGLKEYGDNNGLEYEAIDLNLSQDGAKMERFHFPQQERTIDIKEVSWVELAPRLTDQSIRVKVIDGFSMICYWLGIKSFFKISRDNKYFFVSTVVTVGLMLLWYLSTLGMALELLSDNKSWIPPGLYGYFKTFADHFLGFNAWIAVTFLMGILPVNAILNVSYAAKRYLQNINGLFYRISGRVNQSFRFSEPYKAYDRMTVVAHSFGVAVAVETLARYRPVTQTRIRLITLGGSLRLLTARSLRLSQALEEVVGHPHIATWYDFYSHQDWLCSGASLQGDTPVGYRPSLITSQVPLSDMLSGRSHGLYFRDWDVMKAILSEDEDEKGESR